MLGVTFLSTTAVGLLALLCNPAFSSAFSVETPAFTQCDPVQLSWDSTTGPYNILIANQSDLCGYAVADLGDFDTNSATWIVSIPEGWDVVITVEDAQGNDAWSQPIVVQRSDNISCLSPELAYLAQHPGPTPTSTGTGSTNANASASAAAGANKGSGGAPSTHQIPSSAAFLGTIAIAIVTSALFAL